MSAQPEGRGAESGRICELSVTEGSPGILTKINISPRRVSYIFSIFVVERKGAVMTAGFRRVAFCSAFSVVLASLAFAQEDEAQHRFAGDLYRAGAEVHVDDTDAVPRDAEWRPQLAGAAET